MDNADGGVSKPAIMEVVTDYTRQTSSSDDGMADKIAAIRGWSRRRDL